MSWLNLCILFTIKQMKQFQCRRLLRLACRQRKQPFISRAGISYFTPLYLEHSSKMAANRKERISLLYYRPLSDETAPRRDFNERAWWRAKWGKRWQDDTFYFFLASCPSMSRSLHFNAKFLSDPCDYCKIKRSPAVIVDGGNHL